jgi:hypothetical protein
MINGAPVVLSPLQSSRRVLNFESEKSNANLTQKLNEVAFPAESTNAPWFPKNKVA